MIRNLSRAQSVHQASSRHTCRVFHPFCSVRRVFLPSVFFPGLHKLGAAGGKMSELESSVEQLMELCRHGKLAEVEDHIKQRPDDVYQRDEKERLPIHWSVRSGHLELTKFLHKILSEKESIDADDMYNWTPLMIACYEGQKDVVRFLVDSGADAKYVNVLLETCLHVTVYNDHPEIVEMLIEAGADVNAQDNAGIAPLHRAIAEGKMETIKLLLSNPLIDINISSKQKNTPLHIACEARRTEAATMLVERGALLDKLNEDEKTPLSMADDKLRNVFQQLNSDAAAA